MFVMVETVLIRTTSSLVLHLASPRLLCNQPTMLSRSHRTPEKVKMKHDLKGTNYFIDE